MKKLSHLCSRNEVQAHCSASFGA